MDDHQSCPTCDTTVLPIDAKVHDLLCASFHPSNLPPKPEGPARHILGLHFPPSPPSAPSPVWVKLSSSTDDETSITFQSVDVSPIFPSDAHPEVLYTERNTVRNRDTLSMLEFWTLPAPPSPPPPPTAEKEDAAAVNGSIASLGETHHPWAGPVLALAMTRATGFMVDPGTYRDVTLADAGDVVDFLVDYENPEHGRRIREALGLLGGEKAAGGGTAAEKEDDETAGVRIRCTCGMDGRVSEEDEEAQGNLINCEGCDTWQHMECYYPGKGKSLRFDHRCVGCNTAGARKDGGREGDKEKEPVVFEVL